MLETLASGKLYGKPQERANRDGTRKFVTAKLRCAVGEGESFFVNVIAFSDSAKAALLALDDGDSCALAGTLKVGVWESKDGPRPQFDLIASAALTPYHVRRKRAAFQGDGGANLDKLDKMHGGERRARQAQRTTAPAMSDGLLDEDLPF